MASRLLNRPTIRRVGPRSGGLHPRRLWGLSARPSIARRICNPPESGRTRVVRVPHLPLRNTFEVYPPTRPVRKASRWPRSGGLHREGHSTRLGSGYHATRQKAVCADYASGAVRLPDHLPEIQLYRLAGLRFAGPPPVLPYGLRNPPRPPTIHQTGGLVKRRHAGLHAATFAGINIAWNTKHRTDDGTKPKSPASAGFCA